MGDWARSHYHSFSPMSSAADHSLMRALFFFSSRRRHTIWTGDWSSDVCSSDLFELVRWGVETTIVVPGAFTGGTNHFAHSGRPADTAVVAEYEAGPYKGFADDVMKGFASIVPPDADASAVADAIVKIVDTPFGKRPFRVHVDPTEDGAEVTNMVMDRVRAEMLRRIGLGDLLQVSI